MQMSAENSNSAKPNANRLQYVDALRGLAALMVLVFHTLQRNSEGLPGWVRLISNQGERGVQLFYVISAFTIFLTLDIRSKKEGYSNFSFFIRRFFRIAPLFYCAVLYYLWYYGRGHRWALGDQPYITDGNIISNFFFLFGFNPYWINSIVPVGWSVAVEVTFYCCIPFLFTRITTLKRAIWLTLLTLALSMALKGFMQAHCLISDRRLWNEFLFQWFFNQLPVFCLGIVLYHIHKSWINHQEPARSQNVKVNTLSFSLLTGAIALMSALTFCHTLFLPKHFLFGIAFVLLSCSLAFRPFKLLVNPLFIYMGKVSYSIYLTHVIGMAIAKHISSNYVAYLIPKSYAYLLPMVTLSLVIAITLAISTLTWHLIEVPGQNLGNRLIKRLKKIS